jgi:uncharacterized protein
MRVAIVGASGFVGSAILTEALSHADLDITAIVRDVAKLPQHPRLTALSCDVQDLDALARAFGAHESVVHAYQPPRDSSDVYQLGVAGHRSIIEATKRSGISRLLAVGGAASLKTPQGVEYIDSPLWDKAFDPHKKAILCTRALYYLLKEEKELDWVVIAPSVMLRPGARTTRFRYGREHVLFDAEGNSRISLEDFAFAMISELRSPTRHRERFTIGY